MDNTTDLQSFFIEFYYNEKPMIAEVKPCCQQADVFYYDISFNNTFQFTITPNLSLSDGNAWRVALANSDKNIEPELAKIIGQHIEEHLM